MIFGYIRVSTIEQNLAGQRNLINTYAKQNNLKINEWIELEISSKKSIQKRRIDELIDRLSAHDVVIVSELSRLGRSIKETLGIIEAIVDKKLARLILIKQNLDLNPEDKNNMTNKILITIFSMLAELERDFISERTKEGMRALAAKGVKLGKPKGVVQTSMYDKDREKILELYAMGVPISKIVNHHLCYGRYLSLRSYIKRCFRNHVKFDNKKSQ